MKRVYTLFLTIVLLFGTLKSDIAATENPIDYTDSDVQPSEIPSGPADGEAIIWDSEMVEQIPTEENENQEEDAGEIQPTESANDQADGNETALNSDMNPEMDFEVTHHEIAEESAGITTTETVIYDPQPQVKEEVQAAIDAYESLPWQEAVKPYWQYEVPAELIPDGWHCELVDWDETFGAEYYTFFPNPVPMADIIFSGTELTQADIDAVSPGGTLTLVNDVIIRNGFTLSKKITIRSDDPVSITQTMLRVKHFFINGSGGHLTLENVTLDGGGIGGGIHGFGSNNISLTLNEGAVIQNCRPVSNDEGGGVRMDTGNLILNGGIIRNNEVSIGIGGGVYLGDGVGLTMNGGAITGNMANNGGGIYASGRNMVEISNGAVIDQNVATLAGGGIYLLSGTLDVSGQDTIISNNKSALEIATPAGGGIYAFAKLVDVNCSVTIRDGAKVTDNQAYNGGGIYADKILTIDADVTVTIDHAEISGNTAVAVGGGGIYATKSRIFLQNALISDNKAMVCGGGIVLFFQSALTASDSEIRNNKSAFYGGGIYINPGCMATLMNSEITDNGADNGGGIYTEISDYQDLDVATDVVFRGNRAARAYAPPDDAVTLWNTIRTASSSLVSYSHPVNNYDINVFTHRVIFNSNGGSAVSAQTLAYGNKVVEPFMPIKTNAYFDGWYKDAAFTDPWDFANDVVTRQITLYAKWIDYNLNVSIPVKLLWAAFEDDYNNVDSPDYCIINHSNVPIKVFGVLRETDDYVDEGIELMANALGPNQLRLDILGGAGFSGLGSESNPFPSSFHGLLIDQPPIELGILGGAQIDQVLTTTYGATGWFKIGGQYGGPKPVTALKPVFGMEFAFEAIPQPLDNTRLPLQPPGDPDRGFMPNAPALADASKDFRGKLEGWVISDGSYGEIDFTDQLIDPYTYWQLENILDPTFTDYNGMTISVLDSQYDGMFSIGQDRNGRASIICTYIPTPAEYGVWIAAHGTQSHPEIAVMITLAQGTRSATFKITILYDGLVSVLSI